MFHFFRRIRRKLIADGRLAKYFWYAVGEVLLVMIGILLALQASDWVEDQQNAKAEARYVANLQRDLELQLAELDLQIDASKIMYDQLDFVVKAFSNAEPIKVDKELVAKMSAMIDRRTFTVNDATLRALLSTGDLKIMRNESFKDAMVAYYQRLERTELIIQKNNDTKDLAVQPLAFQLMEAIGPDGFRIETFNNYIRLPSTFENIDPSRMQIETINTILENPQNKLALINIVRFRHALLYSDMNLLRLTRNQTTDLVSQLEQYYD